VPVTSPSIVESKSVKLYLGSYAQSRFASVDAVRATIAADLSRATGSAGRGDAGTPAPVRATRHSRARGREPRRELIAADRYEGRPVDACVGGAPTRETLRTDLFRSVCPVTGQPDYASIAIAYTRTAHRSRGALRYLVSYREHAGFHEHCAERIFVEVRAALPCESLTVHARFTRRGGVDINPFRTNAGIASPDNVRTPRQ
jgi:7-cyano-7-deazaguanine reductase